MFMRRLEEVAAEGTTRDAGKDFRLIGLHKVPTIVLILILERQVVAASGNVDDVENALWMAANTKRCPRCTSPIEKDEGCNHMSCRKCRHEFCWICMQDWSLHSNATGGFFQCNRFVSELASSTSTQGAGSGTELAEAMEEQGNAHLETIRIKERANKMARFIPLYTRLKAHTDSVTMEKRIYPETMNRMVKTLEESSSASKKLLWLQKLRVSHPYDEEEELKEGLREQDGEEVPGRYPRALIPLQQGFEELIKCRMFLIGCVAYSYTVFAATEDDNMESLMRALSRHHHSSYRYHSSMRLDDHKLSFERIQNDLEMYCEMLSDVVARRRLRAATSQISAIMMLVRQKRLELEDLITSYQLQEAKDKESSGSRSSSLRHRTHRSSSQDHGYTSSRSGRESSSRRQSSADAGSSSDFMNRIAIGPNGIIFLQDDQQGVNSAADDDDLDISSLAILIQEMESQLQIQRSQAGPSASASTGGRSRAAQQGINVAEMNDSDLLQLLQAEDYPTLRPASPSRSQQPSLTAPPPSSSTVAAAAAGGTASPTTRPRLSWFGSRSSSSSAPVEAAAAVPRQVSNDDAGSDSVSLESISANITPLTTARSQQQQQLEPLTIASPNSSIESMEVISPHNPSRSMMMRSPSPDRSEPAASSATATSTATGSHLTRRAEEEAALNRAILMSLSEMNQSANGRSNSLSSASPGQSSRSISDAGAANEESIGTLVGMGFERNNAVQALKRCNNDLDAALNSLLG
jgi:hypothetical protein